MPVSASPSPSTRSSAGGTVYLIDWAYPDDRIAIEYNGFEFHGTRSAVDHDAARYGALIAVGWRVLPVTSATTPRALVDNVRAVRALAPRGCNPRISHGCGRPVRQFAHPGR